MYVPERVTVTEVAPRDGLQSLGRWIPTENKVQLITEMVDAGVTSIEVTSFAHPDMVPDLVDAERVVAGLPRQEGVDYRALVPNLRGAERAVEAGVSTLVALMTATDSYSLKNQNRTTAQLLEQVVTVARWSRDRGVPCEAAVGLSFFDPYEGDTPPDRVVGIVDRLVSEGITSIYLAASAGLANPRQVYDLTARVKDRHPTLDLGLHLHTTNGMGLANVLAGLQAGVTRFESAICGIGGGIRMPEGMSQFGNLATEDLVHLLVEMGVDCGLELERVLAASARVSALLEAPSLSPAAAGATKTAVRALSADGRVGALS